MTQIFLVSTPAQIIQIESLANTIWKEHYATIISIQQIDYMLKTFQSVTAITNQIDSGFEYFILNYNTTAVGYLAIKKQPDALFLSKIYVLKEYRGNKIGKNAISFLEQKVKTYQLKSIRLTVNINNTNAVKAYQKLGFKTIKPLITDIGNGFIMDDFEMHKEVL